MPSDSGAALEQKHFAQVAGRSVEPAAGCVGEGGHLGGAGFEQVGELVFAADGENVSAIAGAGEQASTLIEGEGVDQIFARTPQAAGRAVGRDAINFRATRRVQRRE